MALFKKENGFLGVDIGAHGIKLVELKETKGRPQLWTYGMVSRVLDIHPKEAMPTSQVDATLNTFRDKEEKKKKKGDLEVQDARVDEYAALLKEAAKQARITSFRATASLPVSHVFHAVITLPPVDPKELDHHVRAKVKKMLPQPIEEMQVVHQVVPDGKDPKTRQFMRVLVTAAPKELVSFYSAIFSKAGLQLEELETEAFALERSLVGHDTSTVLIVDIGAERTNFFIIDQSLPITHRSIQVGGNNLDSELSERLGVEPELVGQIKVDMSRGQVHGFPGDVGMSLIDPIIKEIEYSVDVFTHQTGNEGKHVEKIILTGGSCLFPPVLSTLLSRFPYAVYIGDPWARVVYQQGLKSVLDSIGPRMAVTIGLALRNIVH